MQPKDSPPQVDPVSPQTYQRPVSPLGTSVPASIQPAAPPYLDPIDQARSAASSRSGYKTVLIAASALVVLVLAASLILTIVNHKPKPTSGSQPSVSHPPASSIFTSQQQKARNAKRQADISSLQTQLEAYFSQNGYYPSLGDMNSRVWLNANMKTLDKNALIDPTNPSQTTSLAGAPTPNQYSYQVTDNNGQSCESDDTTCAKYTLTAIYEGTVDGVQTYVKKNLD